MRTLRLLSCLLWITAGSLAAAESSTPSTAAVRTDAEGWHWLFDGTNTSAWRSLKKNTFPTQGWVVEDGVLKKKDGVRGGDLLSRDQYEEFELIWEWRIPAKANNGVKYFILENRGPIGHEYQMIDDRGVEGEKGKTGAFYDVLPPKPGRQPPRINDWNESRILVRGQTVQHWLNGELVLEYELGSEAVRAGVANSKFKSYPGFGTRVKGHILLTDHGSEAWYRSIRIRVPTAH